MSGYESRGAIFFGAAESNDSSAAEERRLIALMLRGVADEMEPDSTETPAAALRSLANMVDRQEHHRPELASLYEAAARRRMDARRPSGFCCRDGHWLVKDGEWRCTSCGRTED